MVKVVNNASNAKKSVCKSFERGDKQSKIHYDFALIVGVSLQKLCASGLVWSGHRIEYKLEKVIFAWEFCSQIFWGKTSEFSEAKLQNFLEYKV